VLKPEIIHEPLSWSTGPSSLTRAGRDGRQCCIRLKNGTSAGSRKGRLPSCHVHGSENWQQLSAACAIIGRRRGSGGSIRLVELGVARRNLRQLGSPAMTQLATRKGILHRLDPGSISDPLVSEQSRRIRELLLAILRFAVTLEQRDRAAVMCLATQMDRLGASKSNSGFSYFSRTSTKLYDCIIAKHDFDKLAELCFHSEKIDDGRLRRALEGALFAKRNKSARSSQPDREYLWKGLVAK
jgi:hypothetical protein